MSDNNQSVRLDKWLWAARFFKTRALARKAVSAGKVKYDGQRAKPAKLVEYGALLEVPQGFDRMTVEVQALSDQRRGAPEARLLYQETAASQAARERAKDARKLSADYSPHPGGRPDKKQRRELIRMKYTK